MEEVTATPVDPLLRQVGAAIASARASARLTQEGLAAEAGLAQSVVSRIESGRRRVGVDELVRIATVLGVDARELLDSDPAGVAEETLLEELRDPSLAALGWVPRFLVNLERLQRLDRG